MKETGRAAVGTAMLVGSIPMVIARKAPLSTMLGTEMACTNGKMVMSIEENYTKTSTKATGNVYEGDIVKGMFEGEGEYKFDCVF